MCSDVHSTVEGGGACPNTDLSPLHTGIHISTHVCVYLDKTYFPNTFQHVYNPNTNTFSHGHIFRHEHIVFNTNTFSQTRTNPLGVGTCISVGLCAEMWVPHTCPRMCVCVSHMSHRFGEIVWMPASLYACID